MSRTLAILITMTVVAAAAAGGGTPVQAQVIPASEFYVRNTLGMALHCSVRVAGGEWEKRFTIPAGGEFRRRAPAATARLELLCRSPAPAAPFRLVPGERYAFLKPPGKPIELRNIVDGG